MLSAEDLGVDDRARDLLESLPDASQQAILQKLSDGVTDGKIRNASAYVASACLKPDALGIDDRAAELLKQLPKHRRKEVLDKLKSTKDVKNPSAWVAKACLKDSANFQTRTPMPMEFHQPYGKGGYGDPYGGGGKGGYAVFVPHGYGKGGYGGYDDPYGGYGDPFGGLAGYGCFSKGSKGSGPARGSLKGGGGKGASGKGASGLDAQANQLLQTLPANARKEILAKLKTETGIRNPSAWVAKAALQAGATPHQRESHFAGHEGVGGGIELDAEAQELLGTLPESEQQAILDKLQGESGVRNPSAWVVKAALSAGASPAQSRGGASIHSLAHGLDAQAQQLLQTLEADQQEEIIAKLEELKAAGQVRNPSGWVVRAALNAGATPAGGPPPAQKGKGKKRFSPY